MDIQEINNFISVSTDTLEFLVPSRSPKEKPECKISVQNNQNEPIALRVKTTKKENYNVLPTYTIIPPQTKIEITFYLYITETFDEKAKHKFLIEAITYDQNSNLNNAKAYFENCNLNKLKVKGKTAKLTSNFKFGKNSFIAPERSSNIEDQKGDEKEIKRAKGPSIERYDSILPENPKTNNENEIEEIKSEYYKLSNKLSNLIEQNKDLKQKLESEKTTFTSTPGSFSVEEYTGEKEYSRNFMYISFAISVIIGFILSR